MTIDVQIQQLLLNWIRHHGRRKLNDVRYAVNILAERHGFSGLNNFSKFFVPLLQMGFVEYLGDEFYGPANPLIVHNEFNDVATGINLPETLIIKIDQKFSKVEGGPFNVCRFLASANQLKTFCRWNNLLFQSSNIDNILPEFPSIKDVIQSFENTTSTNTAYHFNLKNRKWDLTNYTRKPGLYKTSIETFSNRLFIDDKENCYKVPPPKYNSEASMIAKCYQATLEDIDYLNYNENDKLLRVKFIELPILISRMLLLPSVFNSSFYCVPINGSVVYGNISKKCFTQLKRIFLTK
ncbi:MULTISPECIES: hypothetical protein [Niastella]|uniref:WYL domain-containing protein n=1 Tax=Niastella soli TaxID=2821487 RepID=A0ABS3Z3W3_9BACT|nr:hypothetical protein [Niastella soli]MBO9204854.1 hypothetical protein [Niastella soli]